jgi:hypothetical protein
VIKSESLHVDSVLTNNARPYCICLAGPHRVRKGALAWLGGKPTRPSIRSRVSPPCWQARDPLGDIGGQTRQVGSHDDRSHSNDQFTALIRYFICSSCTTCSSRHRLHAPFMQRTDNRKRRPPLTKQARLPHMVYMEIIHRRSGSG